MLCRGGCALFSWFGFLLFLFRFFAWFFSCTVVALSHSHSPFAAAAAFTASAASCRLIHSLSDIVLYHSKRNRTIATARVHAHTLDWLWRLVWLCWMVNCLLNVFHYKVSKVNKINFLLLVKFFVSFSRYFCFAPLVLSKCRVLPDTAVQAICFLLALTLFMFVCCFFSFHSISSLPGTTELQNKCNFWAIFSSTMCTKKSLWINCCSARVFRENGVRTAANQLMDVVGGGGWRTSNQFPVHSKSFGRKFQSFANDFVVCRHGETVKRVDAMYAPDVVKNRWSFRNSGE